MYWKKLKKSLYSSWFPRELDGFFLKAHTQADEKCCTLESWVVRRVKVGPRHLVQARSVQKFVYICRKV
jgi:hypothetical protein